MPKAARLSDSCTGHGCFPSRTTDQGSPNVFVNNLASHRQGDHWVSHGCATCTSHDSVLASGSGSVYINGKQAGRVGDPIACGSFVSSGSGNVYIGG